MKKCEFSRQVLNEFLQLPAGSSLSRFASEHIAECWFCQKELQSVEKLLSAADLVKDEIKTMESEVNWESLAVQVTENVYARTSAEKKPVRSVMEKFRVSLWPFRAKFVFAGLLAGLIIGSLAMYIVLKKVQINAGNASGFYASREFIDRLEQEMARRQVIDFLDKSQFILRELSAHPADTAEFGEIISRQEIQGVLTRKRYLNPGLDTFSMAKAKAICDQIELLFQELAQINQALPSLEFERIRRLIDERQILLKINIVKKEMKNGV